MRRLLYALPLLFASPAYADELSDAVAADIPELMELYRHLHANPELSFQEDDTAAHLAAIAEELGFEVTTGVGGHGVVAVMENGPGPVLLLRADMDGLPVEEQTGLEFASTVVATTDEGIESHVMHACGHDTHMTAWVGAVRQLVARRGDWSGTLVAILQPAEERGAGARMMLEDGLYERFPRPDYALTFHDSASAPAGTIGVVPGFAMANVDSVDIHVRGVGGHGAYPHTTRDPIVLGSRIVGALQTLVSREVDPQQPAVVTVGSFRAGSKHNIISDEANLLLTVRSYTDEVREQLLSGIERISRAEGMVAGLPEELLPEVTRRNEYTPAVYNTLELSGELMALWRGRFGEDRVLEGEPVMGGEDFSRYYRADRENIQSVLFWVGGVPIDRWEAAQRGEIDLPSLHSAYWAPDAEAVITTATEALVMAALDILAPEASAD
ncbi:amidohydrolase [Parasphingopyxis sp. CP4]|uniref:amidohydrolase n=1 Tax=Parasphingopyxis sp. CP4 TaxID=2724527 RepID=UPI0015A2A01E|nr:amidohydrolase [Parasphingopyxis sp. CP4]QLC22900.1 amidohydrolase [Parasphingopyxis sp. CP4]